MSRPKGNLAAITVGRAIIAVTGLVVNVALARELSRDAFAAFAWINAVTGVAAFGADLGLWQLVTRRIAVAPQEAPRLLGVALQSTVVLSFVTGLAICGYVALADGRPEVVLAAALGAGTLAGQSAGFHVKAAFYGLQRMALEVPGLLAGRLLYVVGHLAVLAAGGGIVAVFGVRVAANALTFLVMLVAFWRLIGPVDLRADAPELRRWIGEGRSFGLAVLFGAVAAQADLLMLQAMSSGQELARYAAPAGPLLQLSMLANILTSGLFPRFSRYGRGAPELAAEIRFQSRMLLLVSVPVAIGGMVVAEPMIDWLFDGRYPDALGPWLLLLAAVPVRFLHHGYAVVLTALDRQDTRARIVTWTAVLNVVANLAAIPWLGATGAAATTLLSDLLLLAWVRWAVARDVPALAEGGTVARTLLPAAAMGVAVLAVPHLHVVLRVGLGAVAYAGLAWVAGGWRLTDLRQLARV